MRRTAIFGALVLLISLPAGGEEPRRSVPEIAADYLESYFAFYPTAATAAGRHDHDRDLPDFSASAVEAWAVENQRVADELGGHLGGSGLARADQLDAELLERKARRELLGWVTLDRSRRDPLLWTGVAAHANVLLLVREKAPLERRLEAVLHRTAALPSFLAQAEEALGESSPEQRSAEIFALAAGQARASSVFYREGISALADRASAPVAARLVEAGKEAANAFERFADRLDQLGATATGSPRLGRHYAEALRLGTGRNDPADLLEEAQRDLAALRREAAAFGRGAWPSIYPDEAVPVSDRGVLARLFARLAEDRSTSSQAFVEEYRFLVEEAIEFSRQKDLVDIPEGLSVVVDTSPPYFIGQSVGGVYPAGPYSPDEATLLFVPTPPPNAPPAAKDAFFRDFNHHFNVMILPHEVIPGHALQLAVAARSPNKMRAMFPDGVYVEGWGTFSERLMLDLGWGDALARLAHYKKQLENVARTIVDVAVHTRDWSREEVLRFVREEALQDEQFASNMWRRSITSAPQLTTYHLGYRQFHDLYGEIQEIEGESFRLSSFLRRVLEAGPVPVERVRQELVGELPASE